MRYGSVGSLLYSCSPLRTRSRSTYSAGFAFMIFAIACCTSGFAPGNQLPYAACRLYARSIATIAPDGDG